MSRRRPKTSALPSPPLASHPPRLASISHSGHTFQQVSALSQSIEVRELHSNGLPQVGAASLPTAASPVSDL